MTKTIIGLVAALLLAGCSLSTSTSGSNTDANAAQSFLPNLSGYIATDANNITEALTNVGAGASLVTGDPVLAALFNRLDALMSCYQSVGAVGAKVYTQVDIGQIAAGQLPAVGVLAVVNQERLSDNFLACAVQTVTGGLLSAQSAQPEPCGGSGTITARGSTIHYIYGATRPDLCATFEQAMQVQASG